MEYRNMSKEDIKETEEIAEDNKGEESFRDYTKRLEKENKELRSFAKTNLFKEVGLDPSQGTGKMAADLYNGKLDSGELSTWLAETYGIQADQNVNLNDTVAAEKIVDSDAKLETLQQQSASIGEEDPMALLNEIVEKGTPEESIRAKMYMSERLKKENKK